MEVNENKCLRTISIIQLVFGGIGIVLGIVAIIYSVYGYNAAVQIVDVEGALEKCRQSFSTATSPGWMSIDAGECNPRNFTCPSGLVCHTGQYCAAGHHVCQQCPYYNHFGYSSPSNKYDVDRWVGACIWDNSTANSGPFSCYARCHQTTRIQAAAKNIRIDTVMCAKSQKDLGCPYKYSTSFNGWGAAAAVVGSVFVMVASAPMLANGLFGLYKKESLARCSGGTAVVFSALGTFGALVSGIVVVFVSYAFKTSDVPDKPVYEHDNVGYLCSEECKRAMDAIALNTAQIYFYFVALSTFVVMMFIISIVDIAITSTSCCLWKNESGGAALSNKEDYVEMAVAVPIGAEPVMATTVETTALKAEEE